MDIKLKERIGKKSVIGIMLILMLIAVVIVAMSCGFDAVSENHESSLVQESSFENQSEDEEESSVVVDEEMVNNSVMSNWGEIDWN